MGGVRLGRPGAHVSTAGGVANSIDRALKIGCESFQIFARNQRQWSPPPLNEMDIADFRKRLASSYLGPVVVHGSYLINPASANPEVRERTVTALADEMFRCSLLGLSDLVIHLGSHGGSGIRMGIERVISTLDRSLEIFYEGQHPGPGPLILLETTAGQRNGVGSRFEHLVETIESSSYPDRLAVCLDTCHMHAAGYDLTTRESYENVMESVLALFGKKRIRCIHLNDSRREMGSGIDRHANLGHGTMGLEPFGFLVSDPRFEGIPMILETPGGEPMYKKELELLRKLRSDPNG